jgi:hypothetical protein
MIATLKQHYEHYHAGDLTALKKLYEYHAENCTKAAELTEDTQQREEYLELAREWTEAARSLEPRTSPTSGAGAQAGPQDGPTQPITGRPVEIANGPMYSAHTAVQGNRPLKTAEMFACSGSISVAISHSSSSSLPKISAARRIVIA